MLMGKGMYSFKSMIWYGYDEDDVQGDQDIGEKKAHQKFLHLGRTRILDTAWTSSPSPKICVALISELKFVQS